jgi:glycosyltransferase involved in cell wall biosynthesis
VKILLVGNYELGDAKSMPRFGEMLRRELEARGHVVRLLRPKGLLGEIGGGPAGGAMGKWLSYVDQYLLFPPWLWAVSGKKWDVVHICDHSNAVYGPWVRGVAPSITCHDLLAIQAAEGRFPQQTISKTGRMLQGWIKRNLLRIKRVVCVSGKTADDLRAMGAMGEIVVIANPLNNDFSPADVEAVWEAKQRVGLRVDEAYVLQVGGNLWYKNRPGAVRIFAAMQRREEFADMRMVMVGHSFTEELAGEVRRLGMVDRVIEVKDPDDGTVRALYTGAAMLLFPSLYEGFGWPIVEAQSCGCLVVTSDRDPMREVAGGAAILVDPEQAEEAAAEIAAEWPRREALRAAGLVNVQRFERQEIMSDTEMFFKGAAKKA